MSQILVFGASISYGAWDIEGGWVQRLRRFLDEKNLNSNDYILVYNLGIPGDTTDDLLKRFNAETEARLEEGEETTFIFSIGVNDSSFDSDKNDLRISPENFRTNIQSLISGAKQISNKIIFVGLGFVEENKTTSVPWARNISYKNESIVRYNKIVQDVCLGSSTPFIEISERLKEIDGLSEDGLHPNFEGHKKIFEIVKDFLISNKII